MSEEISAEEALIRRRPARICIWCDQLDDPARSNACCCTQWQLDQLRKIDPRTRKRLAA